MNSALALLLCVLAQSSPYTCFQTADFFSPELAIPAEMAIVYGANESFPARLQSWKEAGYRVGFMTGIAWGGYDAYFMAEGRLKVEEIQTGKNGRPRMHGESTSMGYNVPTPAYVAFLKSYIEPAVDAGVEAIFLEEPEYWADTGWSEAFKQLWQSAYGTPWEAPDSSPAAQYRASQLKYHLYRDAILAVARHVKARAAAQGRELKCYVATHSLLNYAHWRIVSPMASLAEAPEIDGWVAQVWTGTSRTPNVYKGERKERTFETAFLEYGQMTALARAARKEIWCLHDPIEDNPNRTWADYKKNYEATVVASLLWPDAKRFEVMPWPSRIFQGRYALDDAALAAGDRVPIPKSYASELCTILHALGRLEGTDTTVETAGGHVAIGVSDTMMFERAQPYASDLSLSSFYGLAMPLVKRGIAATPLHLENIAVHGVPQWCQLLVLTYEGQKPPESEAHRFIDAWVRGGGALLYVGDDTDQYNDVPAWWNAQGEKKLTPQQELFERLGLLRNAWNHPVKVGAGWVRVIEEKPRKLAQYPDGDRQLFNGVSQLVAAQGKALAPQDYLRIQRGPYIAATVLDETNSSAPLIFSGRFVDLFDAALPIREGIHLMPGQRALLYDLAWLTRSPATPTLVAVSAQTRHEQASERGFSFEARGPAGVEARARVYLPQGAGKVTVAPEMPMQQAWDALTRTLLIEFVHTGAWVKFEIPAPESIS